MSAFEDSLSSRLAMGKKDPVETDLDYYARPENYTGSNLHAMQRVIFVKQKQSSDYGARNQSDDPLEKLKERYKDIGRTGTPDSLGRSDSRASFGGTSAGARRKLSISSVTHSIADGSEDIPRASAVQVEVNVDDVDNSDVMSESSSAHLIHRRLSLTQSRLTGININSGPAHRSARSSVHSTISMKELKTQMAKERFKHAIKIILILLKWISSLTEKEGQEESDGNGKTFTDIASDAFSSNQVGNSELTFDVTEYKAKKEINISNEVKNILSTNKLARTPEQLQTVLYGLQHLKSFAEYPLHMQEKLCKVAWFQQVPPKRVIIRQGHFAENFYFILSGQAVVRILDKNPATGETQLRTATIMRKGMSFGELALLHHSVRTATVVSQDTVQLLTIGRDDFFDIFMSRSGPDDMPEHIKFVSGLDFMKAWPIESLLEHPEYCLFHFFKRGVVIVKDSNHSDWLYIVKSGSCQVMKELKGVVPSITKQRGELAAKYAVRLPKLGADMFEAKVDTGLRRPFARPGTPSTLTRALTDYDGFGRKDTDKTGKSRLVGKDGKPTRTEANTVSSNKKENISPVFRTEAKKPGYSKSRYPNFIKNQKPHFPIAATYESEAPSSECRSSASMIQQRAKSASSVSSAATSRPGRAKSARTDRSRASSRNDGPRPIPGEIKGPVFVQVEVLKPKDVFGLSTLTFEEDLEEASADGTSVSLVSNGAECIMLSKKFFADQANDKVKNLIRNLIRPYPTEETLQGNLQTKVDWDIYKKKLIKGMVTHKRQISNSFRVPSMC